MVLKVKNKNGDYVELDLFRNEDVTVDYKIFPLSQVGDTGVSYTSSFEIPRTELNILIGLLQKISIRNLRFVMPRNS